MTEDRNRHEDAELNRRSVLKQAGVASAGLVGFPALSTVTAATEKDQERATEARSSRRLLAELNNPTISRATRKQLDGTTNVTGIVLHTELGRLVYTETDTGEQGVQFHVKSDAVRGSTDHDLPERYSNIPADKTGILLADESDDIMFVRPASDTEHRRLASATNVDADDAEIFYNSRVDGFEVHVLDGPSTNDNRVTADGTTSREAYYVHTDATGRITQSDVEPVTTSRLVAMQSQCETWAGRCLRQIPVCTACAGICLTVPATNVPGAIVCITCVMGCHFTIPLACGKTIQNCS